MHHKNKMVQWRFNNYLKGGGGTLLYDFQRGWGILHPNNSIWQETRGGGGGVLAPSIPLKPLSEFWVQSLYKYARTSPPGEKII